MAELCSVIGGQQVSKCLTSSLSSTSSLSVLLLLLFCPNGGLSERVTAERPERQRAGHRALSTGYCVYFVYSESFVYLPFLQGFFTLSSLGNLFHSETTQYLT